MNHYRIEETKERITLVQLTRKLKWMNTYETITVTKED